MMRSLITVQLGLRQILMSVGRRGHALSPLVITLIVVAGLVFIGGCSTEGKGVTRWGAEKNSYHPVGEVVELTASDEAYAAPKAAMDFGTGQAVGLAVDFAEEQLRKEAARHTQQYSAATFHGGGIRSFTMIRKAKISGKGKAREASVAVFSLTLVDNASRMFRVGLEEVYIPFAKAKVASGTKKVDVDYTVAIEGTWTGKGLLQKHDLLFGGAVGIRGYDITNPTTLRPNKDVGYVYIPDGVDIDNLVLRISVVASERDASKAAKIYVRGADLLKENRKAIVGVAVEVGANDSVDNDIK